MASLCRAFKGWLLDYDRAEMDARFRDPDRNPILTPGLWWFDWDIEWGRPQLRRTCSRKPLLGARGGESCDALTLPARPRKP